jgi:hypothetical protein
MKIDYKFTTFLFLSLVAGFLIAWNDFRPNWDDTGITAGLIVLTAALFGYLYPKWPWIWALTIGLWIPMHAIVLKGDFKMLLVALFGFAGAYLGAAVRNNKPFTPS